MNGIIVIDGPAGVGKTSLAKKLAGALNLPYLDTGAMFRFLAWRLGEGGLVADAQKLRELAGQWRFSLAGTGENTTLLANGAPLGGHIRDEKVGALASALATRPEIREILLNNQRELGKAGPLVAEGRDLGTVVFPNAERKFFLEAKPEIRARRRWLELKAKGRHESYEDVLDAMRARDEQDRARSVAPLIPARDAIVVDTSDLSLEQVLQKLLDLAK